MRALTLTSFGGPDSVTLAAHADRVLELLS